MTVQMLLRVSAILSLVAILAACSPPQNPVAPAPVDPQAEKEVREFLREFVEVWDSRDADRILGLLSADFVAPDGGIEEYRPGLEEGLAHGLKYRTDNVPVRIEGDKAAAAPVEASMTDYLRLTLEEVGGAWKWHGLDVLDLDEVVRDPQDPGSAPAETPAAAEEGEKGARDFLDSFVAAWNSGQPKVVLDAMSEDFESSEGDRATCAEAAERFMSLGSRMSSTEATMRLEEGRWVVEPVSMTYQRPPVTLYLGKKDGQWRVDGVFPSRGAPESVEVPRDFALPDVIDPDGSSRPVENSQY